MNLKLIKLSVISGICVLYSCSNQPKKFANAENLFNTYYPLKKVDENCLIIFHSEQVGCTGCRNHMKNKFLKLQHAKKIYTLTNSVSIHPNPPHLLYDSLDLMDKTDLGFINPTLFVKKGNSLEFIIESNPYNEDSVDHIISQYE
ncbi:MAG: hypothetical protein IT247_00815 [Bacteroidia bacterium]|nr:hypothetical protein [Bacteroidia bacterium]